MENDGFKIKFDKNTIDHLGIKLYSTFLPVIPELISNSYDADAENVKIWINYYEKIVTVLDDGIGMVHDEINQNFLAIDRNRKKAEVIGLSKGRSENVFNINYDDIKAKIDIEYRSKSICENVNKKEKSGMVVNIKEIKQLRGILNKQVNKKKRSIELPISTHSTRIVSLEYKPDSKNTLKLYIGYGWQFDFKIHNDSTEIESSLKFDIQIIGILQQLYR